MKPKIVLLALICVIVFNNCSKNSDPVSPNPNTSTGVILLKIDKENAPASVTLIEASLSRTGYDSIFAFLNLLSDSTAEVTLDNIPAGVWHLKVDAKDSVGEVLYTGETDVEILAGFVVQVHLTLYPTGLGTGGIYIYVTWGTTAVWSDFANNPVLSKRSIYYENYGISQPAILKEGNLYRMWYLGDAGSANHYVLYAESSDGISWTRPYTGPVLSPGPHGSWDSLSVHPGAIIKDGNQYKMYYTGWSDTYGAWHIGLATSENGILWTKHPYPVLYGGVGQEQQIGATSIVKIGSTYFLYYFGGNYPQTWNIYLATSSDGISWVRHPSNPILSPDKPWEGDGIYYPSVIEDNGILRMVFMNQINDGFGIATSTDGVSWIKSETNPFFTKQQTANNWANKFVAYPNFIIVENQYRIYYTGEHLNTTYNSKIGFIHKPR